MKRPLPKKDHGFSLVELMVVVAIIGILAALAVPRFQVFQAKAKQSEAKTLLAQIYTLQQAYFGDNDQYFGGLDAGPGNCQSDNDLGFYIDGCPKARYKYTTTASGDTFEAVATAKGDKILAGCGSLTDTWTIDQDKTICAAGFGGGGGGGGSGTPCVDVTRSRCK